MFFQPIIVYYSVPSIYNMKRILFCIFLACLLPSLLPAQKVVSINLEGVINPATADYVTKGILKAQKDSAECLIIHLNTPGGLLESTRLIVSDILESPVPVIVYVSPGGAHAGSAGVFITLSAHIAAMAPGTNIGAAHPVSGQGQILDTIMNEKVTNDARAFIRSIAEHRQRNVEWAMEAVTNSVAITEKEALKENVINLIAANDRELLEAIDGRTVQVAAGSKTIHTREATIETLEMGWAEKLLHIISNPNIAYILFLLGLYGLLFEIFSPGAIFPGVIGGISLILALYAMQTLPVNYAGVALILFAVILFLLEIKVVSHGLLAIGGVVSLLLGSLMLINTDQEWDLTRVSLGIIVPAVVVTTLFFLFVIAMGLKAQRIKSPVGAEEMTGKTGECLTALNPEGTVQVHGEIWNAVSANGSVIHPGQKIRVTGMTQFTLWVEAL